MARARPRLRAPFRIEWDAYRRTVAIVHPLGRAELNRSAGEILSLCDGTRALDDIIDALEARFHATGLAADVSRFIDEARSRGWLD